MSYWRTEAELDEVRQYADVGTNCRIASNSMIDGRRPGGRVKIGNGVTLTTQVLILCHDAAGSKIGAQPEYGITTIGDKTFIGVRTVVLPGVTIGKGVIVGACSLVTKDIPDGEVWAGNPAKFIKTTEQFKRERNK